MWAEQRPDKIIVPGKARKSEIQNQQPAGPFQFESNANELRSQEGNSHRFTSQSNSELTMRNTAKFGTNGGKNSPLTAGAQKPCKLRDFREVKKYISREHKGEGSGRSLQKDESPVQQKASDQQLRGNSTMNALLQSSKRRSGAANGQKLFVKQAGETTFQSQEHKITAAMSLHHHKYQNRSPQPSFFKQTKPNIINKRPNQLIVTRNVPKPQQRKSMVMLEQESGIKPLTISKSLLKPHLAESSSESDEISATEEELQTFAQMTGIERQNLKANTANMQNSIWAPIDGIKNADNFSQAASVASDVIEFAKKTMHKARIHPLTHRKTVAGPHVGKRPPITPGSDSSKLKSEPNSRLKIHNQHKQKGPPAGHVRKSTGDENIRFIVSGRKACEIQQQMPTNSRNINHSRSYIHNQAVKAKEAAPIKTKFAYSSANKTATQKSDMKSGVQEYTGMPTQTDETTIRQSAENMNEEAGIKEFYSLSSAEQQSRRKDYNLAQRLSSENEFAAKQQMKFTQYELFKKQKSGDERSIKDKETHQTQKKQEFRERETPAAFGDTHHKASASPTQQKPPKVLYLNAQDVSRNKVKNEAQQETTQMAKGPSFRRENKSMSPINPQKKVVKSPEPQASAGTAKLGGGESQLTKNKSQLLRQTQLPPTQEPTQQEEEKQPQSTLTGFLSSLSNIFARRTSPDQVQEQKPEARSAQTMPLYGPGKYSSFAQPHQVPVKEESPPKLGPVIIESRTTDPDCNEEEAISPRRNEVLMSPNMSTQKNRRRRRGASPWYLHDREQKSIASAQMVSQQKLASPDGPAANRTRDNINQMLDGKTQFSRFNEDEAKMQDYAKSNIFDDLKQDKKRKTEDIRIMGFQQQTLFNQDIRNSPHSPKTGMATPSSPKESSLNTSANPHKMDQSPPILSPTKLGGLLSIKSRVIASIRGESANSKRSGSSLYFGQGVQERSQDNSASIVTDEMKQTTAVKLAIESDLADQKRPRRSTYVEHVDRRDNLIRETHYSKPNGSPQLKYSVKRAQISLGDPKEPNATSQNREKTTSEEKKSELLSLGNEILKIPGNNDRVGSGASTNYSNNAGGSPNAPNKEKPEQVRARRLQGHTTTEALELFDEELTQFEKQEIQQYKFVYTIGSVRINGKGQVQGRDGFYAVTPGEQIAYRYQVEQSLGRGAFGQVVKCIDYREGGKAVALKISKCSKNDVQNTKYEAKWLQIIQHNDPSRRHSIVELIDAFNYRQHFVLVFELLGQNLYEHIKSSTFKGMPKEQLRNVAKELLIALKKLRDVGIIHCDLKPENIMFTDASCQKVKIIDFGSSCDEYSSGYTYVQSRFYRSPEVTIGVPYDAAIDMWSFGCILAELCTTRPLFPAHDELELLERMRITIGMPPSHMMRNCSKRRMFLDRDGKLVRSKKSNLQPNLPDHSYPIKQQVYTADDDDFIDFLEKCLTMDPAKRLTPEQGLKHRWIVRNKMQTLQKEMDQTSSIQKAVLGDVFDVLSSKTSKMHRNSLKVSRTDFEAKK